MMDVLVRNWWALALRGLVGVLFGILAFVAPGSVLAALVYLYGAYALLDGILALVAAFRAAEVHHRWIAMALDGLISIAAAVIAFVWPGLTAVVVVYIIAAWAIITGALELIAAVRLRREIENEWALGLGGVASIVFGILVMVFPVAGTLTLVWLIGAYALIFGVALLVLAFRLRARMPGAAQAL